MKTKNMLIKLLHRSYLEKAELKLEIASLKMVHKSNQSLIAELKKATEPSKEAVEFAIKWSEHGSRTVTAVAILSRISGIDLKEAKALIEDTMEAKYGKY